MILIHHIIQEIIDIDTCTGIYDRLDLILKLGELKSVSQRDLVQRHLTVDPLND